MKQEDRKHVLRMLEHGLYILGAGEGESAVANAVTWLTQCSFQPPLVVAAIRVEGRLHDAVLEKKAFSVNILAEDQQDMASAFFKPSEVKANTMNGYAFEPGPETGSPLFVDTPAWFEARVQDVVIGGDHTVFVAEVVEAGVRDAEARTLILRDTPWSYGG